MKVLILIILEVTLWERLKLVAVIWLLHGLNPYYTGSYSMRQRSVCSLFIYRVLILIILEVTLWVETKNLSVENVSLNPYYTGSYSMRLIRMLLKLQPKSGLNPYYTGSYSMSLGTISENTKECCLNPYYTGSYSMRSNREK